MTCQEPVRLPLEPRPQRNQPRLHPEHLPRAPDPRPLRDGHLGPRGSHPAEGRWQDPTRDATALDEVADYLLACGAAPLAAVPAEADPAPALF
jgi:hypothetical protein